MAHMVFRYPVVAGNSSLVLSKKHYSFQVLSDDINFKKKLNNIYANGFGLIRNGKLLALWFYLLVVY
jgi:hypothetical protein